MVTLLIHFDRCYSRDESSCEHNIGNPSVERIVISLGAVVFMLCEMRIKNHFMSGFCVGPSHLRMGMELVGVCFGI